MRIFEIAIKVKRARAIVFTLNDPIFSVQTWLPNRLVRQFGDIEYQSVQ